MKRDLLIFGDSWGCGEWSYQTGRAPFIAHPGISQYLSDEFEVKNFSREGASHWMGPSYGDYHPSRQAHQVLSTHIKDFFNREQQ